jgi:hypothetical protein
MPDFIQLPKGATKLPKDVAERLEAARGKHKDGLPEKKVIVRQAEVEVKTEWSTEKLGGDAWSAAIRTLRERGVVED